MTAGRGSGRVLLEAINLGQFGLRTVRASRFRPSGVIRPVIHGRLLTGQQRTRGKARPRDRPAGPFDLNACRTIDRIGSDARPEP
ncbi:hypothetical protein D9Y22_07415 [Methylorubrum sp. DB1722]|nr:hypothetical protein [Methylorubrum sp. DB1722]MRI53495.1 hypothetical protein [Methylobacterium sp. DB1607]